MNHEQGSEVLDMDEQVDFNSTSCSLMVGKVSQPFNGSPVPTFLYTNDTIKAIFVKASLPKAINVNFLNEYNCVLEFPTNFELYQITMHLQ